MPCPVMLLSILSWSVMPCLFCLMLPDFYIYDQRCSNLFWFLPRLVLLRPTFSCLGPPYFTHKLLCLLNVFHVLYCVFFNLIPSCHIALCIALLLLLYVPFDCHYPLSPSFVSSSTPSFASLFLSTVVHFTFLSQFIRSSIQFYCLCLTLVLYSLFSLFFFLPTTLTASILFPFYCIVLYHLYALRFPATCSRPLAYLSFLSSLPPSLLCSLPHPSVGSPSNSKIYISCSPKAYTDFFYFFFSR